MKSPLITSSPADGPRIAQFLETAFHIGPHHPSVQPDHLFWKYWSVREDWEGSRSFLLEREGNILAHGAVWPSWLRTEDETLRGGKVIDWAAAARPPGAGIALMKALAPETLDLIFALGGSEDTRKILPFAGFRPFNEVWSFARPLRATAQAATHQSRDWKLPARWLRNTWWSWKSARPGPRLTSRPVSPDQIRSWPRPAKAVHVFERTPQAFDYYSRCGLVRSRLFAVDFDGKECGYFYLVFAPGQARVADAWCSLADAGAWGGVYALAIERALEDGHANEITASAGIAVARRALDACGFRITGRDRLMVYDPGSKLEANASIHFQMIDNDVFFRHAGRPEYET